MADEVIPPLPPELVDFDVAGRVVSVDGEIVPAVAVRFRTLDGDPVEFITSAESIDVILDGLRDARREARRMTNLARSQSRTPKGPDR